MTGGRGTEYHSARLPLLGRRLLVPLLVLTVPSSGSADLDIRANDGRLTVRAHMVSLVDVLGRLSRETGLKVVYEGRRPSPLITADIEGVSETEAISRLLEGLDVNYAFQTDASGRRVEQIIISGSTGTTPSSASAGSPSRGRGLAGRSVEPPEPEPSREPLDAQEEPSELADPAMAGSGAEVAGSYGDLAPPEFPSVVSSPVPDPFFPPYASYPPRVPPSFD